MSIDEGPKIKNPPDSTIPEKGSSYPADREYNREEIKEREELNKFGPTASLVNEDKKRTTNYKTGEKRRY